MSQTTLERRPNTSTVTRNSGGSVATNLGYGIKVNPKSGLQREWTTVHDSVLPLDFEGDAGVRTTYEIKSEYSSEYRYTSTFSVKARDSISAFEVRFVIFDVWGEPIRTLSETEVEDIPAGTTREYTPKWSVYSENEVAEYYASIGFVARVRAKNGKVFAANMNPILAEAAKFSARFTAADLEPKPQPAPKASRR